MWMNGEREREGWMAGCGDEIRHNEQWKEEKWVREKEDVCV